MVICTMEKSKAEKRGVEGLEQYTIFKRVIKEAFTGKMSPWQRPKVGKGVSRLNIWGKNVSDKRKSTCKGPEEERHLACLSNRRQSL